MILMCMCHKQITYRIQIQSPVQHMVIRIRRKINEQIVIYK